MWRLSTTPPDVSGYYMTIERFVNGRFGKPNPTYYSKVYDAWNSHDAGDNEYSWGDLRKDNQRRGWIVYAWLDIQPPTDEELRAMEVSE